MPLPDCDLSLRQESASKLKVDISVQNPLKRKKAKQEAMQKPKVQRQKKPQPTPSPELSVKTKTSKTQNSNQDTHVLHGQGCQWSTDWSCAYDSAFMAFYFMYKTSHASLALTLSENNIFSNAFVQLLNSCYTNPTSLTFNTQRDHFRDILFHHNQIEFPRYGPNPVSAFEIFHTLNHNPQTKEFNYLSFQVQFINSSDILHIHMPYYLSLNLVHRQGTQSLSIQDYLNTYIQHRTSNQQHLQFQAISCISKPIWLALEIPQESYETLQVSLNLQFSDEQSSTVKYSLTSITYSGSMHFTSRLLDNERVWQYDGQSNLGRYTEEMSLSQVRNNPQILLKQNSRHMCILFYVLHS